MGYAIGELWSIGIGYAIGEYWGFWMQGAFKIAVRDWIKVSIGYTQLLDTHN